ncbi:heterokaryon incompatibility protein-domain-containing protein [Xylaria longipes]|nr:heterokaryon incompatibility protein-domain-containing protein [Xylaria longipes]
MRLINTGSLDLEEFFGSAIPKYAILSHTWENDEVALEDWHNRSSAVKKTGYKKILSACYQARRDNLEYLWVDTNCIDKKSSAELTEAINSMFAWYQNSQRCYVYLADFLQDTADESVTTHSTKPAQFIGMEQLHLCKWFTRGWTLQELLAPDVRGTRAFIRLQEEIIRVSNDQTIFCWSYLDNPPQDTWDSVLAPYPYAFLTGAQYSRSPSSATDYSLTNNGMSSSSSLKALTSSPKS